MIDLVRRQYGQRRCSTAGAAAGAAAGGWAGSLMGGRTTEAVDWPCPSMTEFTCSEMVSTGRAGALLLEGG